jgi:uncharacterized protein (TIGR03083 family)
MESNPVRWISELRRSHDQLTDLVTSLTPEQLRRDSACTEWTVSQVLSHLGSGAELALLTLQAALQGGEAPTREASLSVWGRWNAMGPEEHASGFLDWDTRHLAALEGLGEDVLARLEVKISFLPEPVDAVGLVGLRLGEHELHNWDVRVSFDPGAMIPDSAAELLVDRLPMMMRWTGHGDALLKPPARLAVSIAAPPRRWTLELGQPVALSDPAPDTEGSLETRGETLLRLVTGRLRAEDIERVALTGPIELADLARVFPGF